MGRRGVTYEQVASTAKALVERGIRPSTRAVRDELGTGSYCTIQKHLERWRENALAEERAAIILSAHDDLRAFDAVTRQLIASLRKLSAVSTNEDRKCIGRRILALRKVLSLLSGLGERVLYGEEAP